MTAANWILSSPASSTSKKAFGGHYQAAADLLRTQLAHNPPTDRRGVPLALARLLALHADHGPLPHYAEDQKLAESYPDSAPLLYARSHLDLKLGHPDQAAAEQESAFKARRRFLPPFRPGFQAGKFLSDHGWDDQAQIEFKAYLAMPPGDDQDDLEACEANAHFELGSIALRRAATTRKPPIRKRSAMSIARRRNPHRPHQNRSTAAAIPGRTSPRTEIWAEHSLPQLGRPRPQKRTKPPSIQQLQESDPPRPDGRRHRHRCGRRSCKRSQT